LILESKTVISSNGAAGLTIDPKTIPSDGSEVGPFIDARGRGLRTLTPPSDVDDKKELVFLA
jgi:hypothetical protein